MAANAIAQRNSTSFLKKRPIGAGYRREGPDRFAVPPVAGRSAPHRLRAPSASPASPSVRLPDVTFCEQVAGWAVSLSADRLPASVLERARIQSAAVLAAAEAGEEAAAPLAHAIAIALYQPPFGLWPGFMGPPTKLLTAAEPAVQGARAVLLAAEGLTGPLDVVEHPRGLLRHFSYVPRPAMLGALGS